MTMYVAIKEGTLFCHFPLIIVLFASMESTKLEQCLPVTRLNVVIDLLRSSPFQRGHLNLRILFN